MRLVELVSKSVGLDVELLDTLFKSLSQSLSKLVALRKRLLLTSQLILDQLHGIDLHLKLLLTIQHVVIPLLKL